MDLSEHVALCTMLEEVGAKDVLFQYEHNQVRFTLLGSPVKMVWHEPGITPIALYWEGRQFPSFGPLKSLIRAKGQIQ